MKFLYGITNGPNRPHSRARERFVNSAPKPRDTPKLADGVQFSHAKLPVDVIVMVDANENLHLAIDWNADLKMSDSETVAVGRKTSAKSKFVLRRDSLLLLSGAGDDLRLNLWALPIREASQNDSPTARLLKIGQANPDIGFELVWLDWTGDPAGLAASVCKASQLGCDFVVADVRRSKRRLSLYSIEQNAELLRELSSEYALPIVINARTASSPNFVLGHTSPSQDSSLDDVLLRMVSSNRHAAANLEAGRELRPKANPIEQNVPSLVPVSLIDEDELPSAIIESARLLLNRPGVHSWWYRPIDSRHSESHSIAIHLAKEPSPWQESHLCYREFFETGWCSRHPIAIGQVGRSTAQTRWILVQAPTTKRNATWEPPKLAQTALDSKQGEQSLDDRTWQRHYDNDALAKGILREIQEGASPSQILSRSVRPDLNSSDIQSWRNTPTCSRPSITSKEAFGFCDIRCPKGDRALRARTRRITSAHRSLSKSARNFER